MFFTRKRAAHPPSRDLGVLRPGAPVEDTFQHPDGELYLDVRRSRRPEPQRKHPALGGPVAMQWMGAAPARVMFTMDEPEHFDPEALPAWDMPSPADVLVISAWEGHEVARLHVPDGFHEIHVLAKRKHVSPRVVVYLVPLGRQPVA